MVWYDHLELASEAVLFSLADLADAFEPAMSLRLTEHGLNCADDASCFGRHHGQNQSPSGMDCPRNNTRRFSDISIFYSSCITCRQPATDPKDPLPAVSYK